MLFPRIPSLIDSSAEGIWTEELMLKARTCFEVEAANVEMAVCMPEVFAHEELKADGYNVAFCYEEAIGFCLGASLFRWTSLLTTPLF